jgi:proteasome alpha subunit
MLYSPYDWNEAIRHRSDYIEERLAEGSPVLALSCAEGVLLLTLRGTQRKLFEIYDRLAFAALGQQADIEAVRLSVIDFSHQEGFTRSPDDVTVGRVVAAVSPALKKAFGDPLTAPLVLRALFAEVGRRPDADALYVLGYDGEFRMSRGFAVVAGSPQAEERMRAYLAPLYGEESAATDGSPIPPNVGGARGGRPGRVPALAEALEAGLGAWAAGWQARKSRGGDDGAADPATVLREALREATVEAALLERHTERQNRFRELTAEEVAPVVRACSA